MSRVTGLNGEGHAFKARHFHTVAGGGGRGTTGGGPPTPAGAEGDGETHDGSRPEIHIREGEIERIVDEAEAALIDSDRGLYQRGGLIVGVGEVKITTSGAHPGVAQRIMEREDNALVEDLTAAAVFQRFNERKARWGTVNAPMWVAKTLRERGTRLRLPVLTGIVNAPTLRPDGTVLDRSGYDHATGLLYDPRGFIFPPIPAEPSRIEAIQALDMIEGLFATMPFVDRTDRAVAVSTVLTACTRNAYPTAPMHAVTAPAAGSGKSMIVDAATMVATGRRAAVLALGKTPEETEKRLGGALLSGDPVLALDNCEVGIGGDLLCQMLTQETVRVRALGGSTMSDLPTNVFVTATGNNLVIVGDMTRRTVLCRIDAGVERPELRVFDGPDPVAAARLHRAELVTAAVTLLRAYAAAGRPPQKAALGSFEEWSRTVRDALLWAGSADPVGSMDEARASDPEQERLVAVLIQWRKAIGFEALSVSQIVERAGIQFGGEYRHPEFRTALLTVAGVRGSIDNRRLGMWLSAKKDKPVDGLKITKGKMRDGYGTWHLHETFSPSGSG